MVRTTMKIKPESLINLSQKEVEMFSISGLEALSFKEEESRKKSAEIMVLFFSITVCLV